MTIDFDLPLPRIYASFAEFERDERARLGLDPLPDPGVQIALAEKPAASPDRAPRSKRARERMIGHSSVTPAALRAEGVLEVGCAIGTSVLYVRTRAKLHLLHVTWLPDRRLDDYAVSLAMNWIENCGMRSYEVANNFGVSEDTLRRALLAAGHERAVSARPAALKRGNRRGRFMRRDAAQASAP